MSRKYDKLMEEMLAKVVDDDERLRAVQLCIIKYLHLMVAEIEDIIMGEGDDDEGAHQ